jgi:Xaa-Pro aminopeptidase
MMMGREPYSARLARFRELLARESLDAFIVAVPENRYYLSAYEAEDLALIESSGYLLISADRQILLTDFRYQEEARREAPDFELVIYSDGLGQALPDLFASLQTERLGFEKDYLTFKRCQDIETALHSARPAARMVPSEDLTQELRIVKDASEIERIRMSLHLTESVLHSVWNDLRTGMKEKDVAWKIERGIREKGADSVSFPPIVASGPNAALPHAVPTERTICEGDAVILDLGSKLGQYCSDMTRTWIAGPPEKRLAEIYKIVREAQLAAQDAIHAGAESVAVDAVARGIIDKAGYGDLFGHGLGHGVGLAVHEKPGLRMRHPAVLQANMVVTVEPGIYIPGYGGVRLENMVRITENGCEVLNELDLFYEL